MGNFEFLEKINPSIANLANTAEKLFRDEYFDQCIVQTRKMAEIMTRNVLGTKAQEDDTFDDMLYKLKTISNNNFREQEFISDMYFLKKNGNMAVHSQNSSNNGKLALECLEHAFEASVNYAYAITHSDKINRLIFDEKLLVLEEKNTTLQEEYKNKLEEIQEKQEDNKTIINRDKEKNIVKKDIKKSQKYFDKKQDKKDSGILKKIFIGISSISILIIFLIFILQKCPTPKTYKIQEQKNLVTQNKKRDIKNKEIKKSNNKQYKYSLSKTFSSLK